MASRGDDVFSRERLGTRPRRPRPPEAAGLEANNEAVANEAATRSGMFGSTRLSGGSFKGRFPTGGSGAADRRYLSSSECATPASEAGGSSSSSSSLSLGGGPGCNSTSRSSGLNRIESGASSIKNYASRYIEAIRPRGAAACLNYASGV